MIRTCTGLALITLGVAGLAILLAHAPLAWADPVHMTPAGQLAGLFLGTLLIGCGIIAGEVVR